MAAAKHITQWVACNNALHILGLGVGIASYPCMGTVPTCWRREVQAARIFALAGLQQQGCVQTENIGSTEVCVCGLMALTVEVAPSWKGVKGASGEVKPA